MRVSGTPSSGAGRAGAAESREATDRLLAGLRDGGWTARSWVRFGFATVGRSLQQALAHPRAVAEIGALHGSLALLAGRGRRGWVATSWVMAVTHLGLLGERRSIGAASALTLARANLPAFSSAGSHRGLGAAVVLADKADGVIARRAGPTQFGHYADALADASFWTWFAWRHENDRRWLLGAALAWVAPVALVAAASITNGAMVEVPRSALVRPAAAMQALLAVRALRCCGPSGGYGPAITVERPPSRRNRRLHR